MRLKTKSPARALVRWFALAALALGTGGCSEDFQPGDPELTIDLRWVKSFPRETRADVETGLLWVLSFLGATLPREMPDVLSWNNDTVTLHLDRAGIDAKVLPQWARLLTALKASEEYRLRGALDVGRFVALTLCSSWHYYVLTDASTSYEQARTKRSFDSRFVAVVESTVAHGDRLLEVSLGLEIEEIAFIGHEGTGSIRQGSFRQEEHELLDVMANGQLRFALYGADGVLKAAASEALTSAGKPSKCFWCHETHIQRPFDARSSVEDYYSLGEFEEQVGRRMEQLHDARAVLKSRIDFSRDQEHTLAELLYLAFYEPSAERIAREWNVPIEQVRQKLAALETHANTEFDFIGTGLYRRSEVDSLAPYSVLEVPTDPREPSTNEPNLLH